MLVETAQQLPTYGFRVLVLMAGHYPWQGVLEAEVPALRRAVPEGLIVAGSEMNMCGEPVTVRGDHAAHEETSFGLALFPEELDLTALTPDRDKTVWPGGTPPPTDRHHPRIEFEAAAPLFAQLGENAREATAARGEEGVAQVVDHLARTIDEFLERDAP